MGILKCAMALLVASNVDPLPVTTAPMSLPGRFLLRTLLKYFALLLQSIPRKMSQVRAVFDGGMRCETHLRCHHRRVSAS